jgi:hypothetical protein
MGCFIFGGRFVATTDSRGELPRCDQSSALSPGRRRIRARGASHGRRARRDAGALVSEYRRKRCVHRSRDRLLRSSFGPRGSEAFVRKSLHLAQSGHAPMLEDVSRFGDPFAAIGAT